jgi:hypothetical protein
MFVSNNYKFDNETDSSDVGGSMDNERRKVRKWKIGFYTEQVNYRLERKREYRKVNYKRNECEVMCRMAEAMKQ